MNIGNSILKALLKAPIILYRYTLSAFAGRECRYLPTCSDYAEQAIDKYGPWKGLWLATSRLSRCNPWAGSGFDPLPDALHEHHPWWAPWRYGRWSGVQRQHKLDNTP